MSMSSYLLAASCRKDCLFALLPNNGGSVISPLRQDTGVYPVPGSTSEGSWAKRNGLITMKNILYANNTFSSLDATAIAQINTPLDFKGNTTSKTFIGKFKFNLHENPNHNLHSLFSQGYFPGSKTLQVFSFIIWETASTIYFKISISINDGNQIYFTSILDEEFFEKEHTVALVCDIDQTQNKTKMYLYCDKLLLQSYSASSALPWSTSTVSPYDTYPVSIRSDIDTRYLCNDQLYWAMIFDSALTAEEIFLFQ